MDKYNGWTNRETWLVNLWFMDSIDEPISADYLSELVHDYIDNAISEEAGFVRDLLNTSAINWSELAETHNSDIEEYSKES